MVRYKSEWKDVRAAFWFGLFIGVGLVALAWVVTSR
jgi:hypothetical protein